MARNSSAGTLKDAGRVASTIAQASAVAEFRGDQAPANSRPATMYLQANRAAGGPVPQRSPHGPWWHVSEREAQRCELASSFGYGPNAAGPLGSQTAADMAAAQAARRDALALAAEQQRLAELLDADDIDPP